MVAYEMARHRKPDAVVLIASCRTRECLRHGFRASSRLMPWVPVEIWSVAKWLAPSVVAGSRRYDAAVQARLVRMFQEMDSAFMHWALSAILDWTPTMLAGVRVFQIHGGRDLLIPARAVDADAVIPDGGHMINLTHAEEVNAFIAKAAACAG
jgi:pimeloyl-ACP methyl ester carboxylesterase